MSLMHAIIAAANAFDEQGFLLPHQKQDLHYAATASSKSVFGYFGNGCTDEFERLLTATLDFCYKPNRWALMTLMGCFVAAYPRAPFDKLTKNIRYRYADS